MAGLPTISGKEAIKAFQNAGWLIERTGSNRHVIMKKTRYNNNVICTRP